MQAYHTPPVELSKAQQFVLVASFMRTKERVKNSGADARVNAYNRFSQWEREIAIAIRGRKGRALNEACGTWFACRLIVEKRME